MFLFASLPINSLAEVNLISAKMLTLFACVFARADARFVYYRKSLLLYVGFHWLDERANRESDTVISSLESGCC